MPARHQHWVGGKPHAPADGSYLPTMNPATAQPGESIAAGNDVDVNHAVQDAFEAQPVWDHLPAADRSEVLHRIASAIESNAPESMEAEGSCTGKTESQLHLELWMSTAYFRYCAGVLQSGYGRKKGLDALHEYAQAKTISLSLN
jgi:acyl-CoA reductase-like NAD-dependent aldehyde dehydrogenase